MTNETRPATSTGARRGNGAERAASDRPTTETHDVVRMAADEVRGALDTMSRSVPDVARASRGLVDDALRAIDRGSDERLSAGLTLSLGFAIGLMVGGAPRILTALALVPVAAIGLAMVDRQTRSVARPGSGTSLSAG